MHAGIVDGVGGNRLHHAQVGRMQVRLSALQGLGFLTMPQSVLEESFDFLHKPCSRRIKPHRPPRVYVDSHPVSKESICVPWARVIRGHVLDYSRF